MINPMSFPHELNAILEKIPLLYSDRLYDLTMQDSFQKTVVANQIGLEERVRIFNTISKNELRIDVGFGPIDAEIQPYELWLYYIPLGQNIFNSFETKKERYLVGVCGPPGSGKSYKTATLCAVMQVMYGRDKIQWVPFDGFHFSNEYLRNHFINTDHETLQNHPALSILLKDEQGYLLDDGQRIPLKAIKGMAPTFDAESAMNKYREYFENSGTMYFPFYDRKIHDPVPEGNLIPQSVRILLTEGNFLFLDEGRYRGMPDMFDLRIFLDSIPESNLRSCFNRHLEGGKSKEDAQRNLDWVDSPNQTIVNATKARADLAVKVNEKAAISAVEHR